jgi:uncharacterized protein YukE
MTSFAVNHGGMAEINDGLVGSLHQMVGILGRLDDVLRTMPNANSGQAIELWGEQQGAWHRACDDMQHRLMRAQQAHSAVGSAFLDGDNQGAKLMM